MAQKRASCVNNTESKTNNNMNQENYDPCFPDQPVVDLYLPLWANLPAFRSKPAFIWAEDGSNHATKTLTYAQLNDSVQSISSQLLIPLQRGDTVVILCSPGLELVEIIFGCQRAGLLSVPIFPPDPSFPKQNYLHLVRALSQTKPKAAIAHRDYITKVQKYISSPFNDKKLAQMLQNLKWVRMISKITRRALSFPLHCTMVADQTRCIWFSTLLVQLESQSQCL